MVKVVNSATLYALERSPTSCQAVLQSFCVKGRRSRDCRMHHDWKDHIVVRGTEGPRYAFHILAT
jgi:hypothetical protein